MLNLIRYAMVLVGFAFVPCMPASAAFVSIGSARDNTLYEDPLGALSNGAGQHFFAGKTNMNVVRRGLIGFDIAANIPAGSIINSVSLSLHVSQTGPGSNSVALHAVAGEWGEGSSDAEGGEGGGIASTPGDATWIHSVYSSTLWNAPGGDFNSLASASLAVGGVGFYSWTSAQMVADAQAWLDSPAGNYGWLLKGNEAAANSTKRFDSRENPESTFRPVLLIEYTPIPAPSALACVAIATLCRNRRRRRSTT